MDFQMSLMAATVILMLLTVATKYISTILTVRQRNRLHEVTAELASKRTRLKVIENEKAVAEGNEKSLTSQKSRLEKRIPTLRKELESLDR